MSNYLNGRGRVDGSQSRIPIKYAAALAEPSPQRCFSEPQSLPLASPGSGMDIPSVLSLVPKLYAH